MKFFEEWLWQYYGARFFLMFDNYHRAAEALHLSLNINSRFHRGLVSLGFIYASLQQYSVAARYFEDALSINPQDAKALFNLGYV
ncbi:MAG TPA: tetratricopeptide repeat protein [Burkholderiales bacterium]|nr:tetratricopeptide repeat protein [Burkholderiales bacterium]